MLSKGVGIWGGLLLQNASGYRPRLSSATVWSPILNDKEIGREEALF